MFSARNYLVGLLALGWWAALAAAQEPAAKTPELADTLLSAATPAGAPCVKESFEPCGCCRGGRWSAGVGLYLLQPYFENNTALAVQTVTAGAGVGGAPALANRRVDVSHSVEVAPLIWVGYAGENGWGGRARYWYFRAGTSQTESGGAAGGTTVTAYSNAPLGLGLFTGGTMNVTTKLEVQAADLEVTQDYRAGNWDFLFAGGIRIARFNQAYNAYIDQGGANTVLSGHSFQGVGPSLAAEARRPFGDSGLALYASARGAIVVGTGKQSAFEPVANLFANDHRDRSLPIGELELGVEYQRELAGAQVFGQVAVVGQEWVGAGGAARAALNVTPGGGVANGAYVSDGDLSFLGVSFRIGLNY